MKKAEIELLRLWLKHPYHMTLADYYRMCELQKEIK